MYGKFVGLDIGSSSAKITLIQRGLRDVKLLKSVQINYSDPLKSVSESPEELFSENGFPKNDVAVSIQSNPVSIRILKFPFSDPKKVDQVYEFELENASPFDPKNKFHSYQLIKQPDGSEAVVCMFEKEHVRQLFDTCEAWGTNPKIATFTPLALGAVSGFLPQERPLVVINIGASKMTFSLFDERGVRRVRSSSKAGNFITESITRSLGISFQEADALKRAGLKGAENRHLQNAVSAVVDEIKKTVQFFENEIKGKVERVLISGGTSLMPGIGEFIEAETGIKADKLFISDLGRDESPVFSDSFALALYGSALKSGSLNLRKGEFRYSGKNEEFRKTFMLPVALLALLIIMVIYRSGERHFQLKDSVEDMQAQIEREVRQVFPAVKVIPRPVAFMEGEVRKIRTQLELFEGIRGGSTPLNVLRNISTSIPKTTNLTLDEVAFVDNRTVRIIGKSGSYEEVAGAEKALSDSDNFERVLIDSTDTNINNSIRFQMTLVLK
jgi:Tfp pilus assembly PilM family ATPase